MLENFDAIMATKLDEIEELKVTGLDKGSKLLNIISLCANVKTLILEGGPNLNVDKILGHIFKPEQLENLHLNKVKLPVSSSLKRYTNLQRVTLVDIPFGKINEFFANLENPENLKVIQIRKANLFNHSFSSLERFSNLEKLELKDLENVKLENLEFLSKNPNLSQLELQGNLLPITELNHILDCQCHQNIDVWIADLKGNKISDSHLLIQNGISEITILIQDLKFFFEKVDLTKVNRIKVRINECSETTENLKSLSNSKAEIHILLNDFSCLNLDQIQNLQDELKIKNVEFVNQNTTTKLPLKEYRKIRKEIETTIQNVPSNDRKPEKFLAIYQTLGKQFEVVEEKEVDFESKKCTPFQMCELLQNCLKCVGINSHIIAGEELVRDKKHFWNQVELNGKWYHTDLVLDRENIQKNRVEYCLLGDKDFLETHTPRTGKNHYCAENFNPKLVNVFFKTGLFKEKLLASYVEIMFTKMKKLFQFGKKEEVLALPQKTENEPKKED